jgi:hypothetical protein
MDVPPSRWNEAVDKKDLTEQEIRTRFITPAIQGTWKVDAPLAFGSNGDKSLTNHWQLPHLQALFEEELGLWKQHFPIRCIDIVFVTCGQLRSMEFGLERGICLKDNPACEICGVSGYCDYARDNSLS